LRGSEVFNTPLVQNDLQQAIAQSTPDIVIAQSPAPPVPSITPQRSTIVVTDQATTPPAPEITTALATALKSNSGSTPTSSPSNIADTPSTTATPVAFKPSSPTALIPQPRTQVTPQRLPAAASNSTAIVPSTTLTASIQPSITDNNLRSGTTDAPRTIAVVPTTLKSGKKETLQPTTIAANEAADVLSASSIQEMLQAQEALINSQNEINKPQPGWSS